MAAFGDALRQQSHPARVGGLGFNDIFRPYPVGEGFGAEELLGQ